MHLTHYSTSVCRRASSISSTCAKPSRRAKLCRANAVKDRAIFQLYPTRADTNLLDVRDAYEACSRLSTAEEKRACYAVFGLDADRVEKYYRTVLTLEQALAKDEEPVHEQIKLPFFQQRKKERGLLWTIFDFFVAMFAAVSSFNFLMEGVKLQQVVQAIPK